MKNFYLLSSLLIFTVNVVNGQNSGLGSWNILHAKINLNEKWSVFGEAQLRSLEFYDRFHYYEYKGGVNYKVLSNVIFTFGAGDYNTYKEGGNFVLPMNKNEFRLWPQIALIQSIGKLKIEHSEWNLGLQVMATATDIDTGWVFLIRSVKRLMDINHFN